VDYMDRSALSLSSWPREQPYMRALLLEHGAT
jgi:hypothetical protein